MAKIHLKPDDKFIEVGAGKTVLHAALEAGIPHIHTCQGKGRCSTCRVMVVEGLEHCPPRTEKEKDIAAQLGFSADIRLACQMQTTHDMILRRLVIDDQDILLSNQLAGEKTPISTAEEIRLAILFADIRGFTAFSERLPPYDVMHVLNRYFHKMAQVIELHGGYVDNYMGDGLLALFGLEKPENAALEAVLSGIEMLQAMRGFQPYLESLYRTNLEIGIGIHFGKVVIGVIGACNRRRKTAIGDEVNFASRIEAANKQLHTNMLISGPLYDQVMSRVRVKKHGPMQLKGKSGAHPLFEVIDLHNMCDAG